MEFELNHEQKMWQKVVHDFVAMEVKPGAQHVDETATFNWDAYQKMASIGLLGLNVEEDYGGTGVDSVSAAIAIEELGWGAAVQPYLSPRTTDSAVPRSPSLAART